MSNDTKAGFILNNSEKCSVTFWFNFSRWAHCKPMFCCHTHSHLHLSHPHTHKLPLWRWPVNPVPISAVNHRVISIITTCREFWKNMLLLPKVLSQCLTCGIHPQTHSSSLPSVLWILQTVSAGEVLILFPANWPNTFLKDSCDCLPLSLGSSIRCLQRSCKLALNNQCLSGNAPAHSDLQVLR